MHYKNKYFTVTESYIESITNIFVNNNNHSQIKKMNKKMNKK